jgi:hypothetical protein
LNFENYLYQIDGHFLSTHVTENPCSSPENFCANSSLDYPSGDTGTLDEIAWARRFSETLIS